MGKCEAGGQVKSDRTALYSFAVDNKNLRQVDVTRECVQFLSVDQYLQPFDLWNVGLKRACDRINGHLFALYAGGC